MAPWLVYLAYINPLAFFPSYPFRLSSSFHSSPPPPPLKIKLIKCSTLAYSISNTHMAPCMASLLVLTLYPFPLPLRIHFSSFSPSPVLQSIIKYSILALSLTPAFGWLFIARIINPSWLPFLNSSPHSLIFFLLSPITFETLPPSLKLHPSLIKNAPRWNFLPLTYKWRPLHGFFTYINPISFSSSPVHTFLSFLP